MYKTLLILLAVSCTGSLALAGDTGTSAAARRGSSQAAAWYQGRNGWAQTESRSGWVNFARGTAVSWDRRGTLDVSTSYAVHTPRGGSVAGSLHIGADRNGAVVSGSRVTSQGRNSSAAAGGRIVGHRAASAHAQGNAGPRGRVQAESFSRSFEFRDRVGRGLAPYLFYR
jgi:hypothetical protein